MTFFSKNTIIAVILFTAQPAFTQVFSRFSDGAASLAMGGANVANPNTEIGFFNEALLARFESIQCQGGSAMPYSIPEWRPVWVSAGIPMGRLGAVGILFQHSGLSRFYAEQRLQAAYARRLAEHIYVGIGAAALRVSAAEYGSATGVDLSVSALARVRPTLWLGVKIFNPASVYFQGVHMPSGIRTGFCWDPSSIFNILAEVEKYPEAPLMVRAGLSYRPFPRITFRMGWHMAPACPAFGMGINFSNGLRTEAAVEWHPALGFTPALQFAWKKPGRKS